MKSTLAFLLGFTTCGFAQPWQPMAATLTGSSNAFIGNTHSWADFDGDGDYDLYIDNHVLWLNAVNVTGNFIDRSDLMPVSTGSIWSAAFGDFNNDGKPDLHLGKGPSGNNSILENRYPAPAVDVSAAYGYLDSEWVQPVYWGDYNNDGLLDIYATHEIPSEPHEFWQNDYPGDFIPRFPQAGGTDLFGLADLNSHAYGLAWGDIDLDGDIDVVTSACGAGAGVPGENPHNKVYENQTINLLGATSDSFRDRTESSGVGSSSERASGSDDYWATLFDFDNDGFVDLFIGDNSGQHRLWQNTGKAPGDFSFELVDSAKHGLGGAGAFGYAGVPGDYDNDGDLDLLMTSSGIYTNESGQFSLSNHVPGTSSFRDGSWVDYNQDGFLDVLNQTDLYLNPGNGNHWLSVELEGTPTLGTTRGANNVKIQVTTGDLVQTREHRFMVATYSQHMLPTHFGLGSATEIDEVRVFWPAGPATVLTNLVVDQHIRIMQSVDCSGDLSTELTTDIAYCWPLTTLLQVASSNEIPIRWRVRNGPTMSPTQFSDTAALSTSFTPATPGIYEVVVEYDGCPAAGLTFLIHDTDFNGDGAYTLADVMVALPSWVTNQDLARYDLDGNGTHNIQDMLRYCEP